MRKLCPIILVIIRGKQQYIAIAWHEEKASSLNNNKLFIKKIVTSMDKNSVIHIGAELNISSESVQNVENKTEVNIQFCCNKV